MHPSLRFGILIVLAAVACNGRDDHGSDGGPRADAGPPSDTGRPPADAPGPDAMLDPACVTLCGLTATFDCTQPGGITGTASIASPTADGCTGQISTTGEAPLFWIHCAGDEICVEHETECFPATYTTTGFTYTIPGRSPITCTAR